MQTMSNKKSPENILHLLKALPLVHFLRKDCTPHQKLLIQPKDINWIDQILNTEMMKITAESAEKTCKLV